jgi:hypothetical protein
LKYEEEEEEEEQQQQQQEKVSEGRVGEEKERVPASKVPRH